jgi:hypothetical protein
MAIIDLSNTNTYPRIKRVSLGTTAQEITLPPACTQIKFLAEADMYWANEGSDGDGFTTDILEYAKLPANVEQVVQMERGNQSNRKLLVAMQTDTGSVSIVIEKD